MGDFLRSLPQGVYWFPALLVMGVLAVRTIMATVERRHRFSSTEHEHTSLFEHYAYKLRISRYDLSARGELERICIGMLLTAVGYRGYSIANCRDYVGRGAPEAVADAIQGHLAATEAASAAGRERARGTGTRTTGEKGADIGLPPRCEVIISYIEEITEAQSGQQD